MQIYWLAIYFIYILFKQIYIFQQMQLKKESHRVAFHQDKQSSYGDCSCEILDTSLSNIGESDCSCSECLEANLQAFNQMKDDQEDFYQSNDTKNRGSTRVTTVKQTRNYSKNASRVEQKTNNRLTGYKSVRKLRQTRPKTTVQISKSKEEEVEENGENTFPQFSHQCINDYIKITQYRAREYLKQRKAMQLNEKQQRQKLKIMIKENLQALKFTAKQIRKNKLNQIQNTKEKGVHTYKWSHQPYHCKSKTECKKEQINEPDHEYIGAKQYQQKLQLRIKKYKQESKQQPYECPDQCPKHHLRTQKKKLIQIQRFIQKKAKKHMEAHKKAKLQRQEKKRIKQAKLRAIDLRCKDIVAKSKKYDQNQQRTSFHNSIDHFSTFSQLKQNNKQKLQQKKKKEKLKKAMKEGGALENAIYENIQDQLIGDHPPIKSKIDIQSKYHHQQHQPQEEWCEKIVKEARIKPPKELRQNDKLAKTKKEKSKQENKLLQNSRKSNKNTQNDLKKEEKRRKEIQQEIQKKKLQILKQYQKRNSNAPKNSRNDPKNKQLRQSYQQKISKELSPQANQDREIFTKSGSNLMNRNMLKI